LRDPLAFHPLCFRNAESYLEIAEGYVGYLTALAAKSDDFARMVVERVVIENLSPDCPVNRALYFHDFRLL
jgi:hypothetical protein